MRTRNRRSQGLAMIDILVYIALSGLILNLAGQAFYRSLSNMRDLQRNSDGIAQALKVGEVWREDIRRAESISAQTNHLCCNGAKPVCWSWSNGVVYRQMESRPAQALLQAVAASSMRPDLRGPVAAYRWELELASRKEIVRVRPLFQFAAVPGSSHEH